MSSYIKTIIIIQKYIRRFLIPSSYYQTKKWRLNQTCKNNECEKYQINLINKIIKDKLIKTNDIINIESYEIIDNKHPMKYNDGYEWTEKF